MAENKAGPGTVPRLAKMPWLTAPLWITTFLPGCRSIIGTTGGTAARQAAEWCDGATGTLAWANLLEPLRLFFTAGIGFIVLGSVLIMLSLRRQGVFMLVMGLATTATGVLFSRYPWVVLGFALAAAATVVALLWAWLRVRREAERARRALAATVKVIEDAPEGRAIKQGLRELGGDVEEQVREAIEPVKKKLRREARHGEKAEKAAHPPGTESVNEF